MKVRSTLNRITDVGKYNVFIRRNQDHNRFIVNTGSKSVYKGRFPIYTPIKSTDMDLVTYLNSTKSKWKLS